MAIDLRHAGISPFRAQHGDLTLGSDPDSPRARSLTPIERYYRKGKITIRQRGDAARLYSLWARSGYDAWARAPDSTPSGQGRRGYGMGPTADEYHAAMGTLDQLQGVVIRQVVLQCYDLRELASEALGLDPLWRLLKSGLDRLGKHFGA